MNRTRKSTQVAVGGFSTALCFVVMMLSGILPLMTYALPALAGVMLLPCAIELGKKTALTAYVAVSLLTFFMLPDKETAMMFCAFFGYYPIVKFYLEKVRNKLLKVILKLILFNGTIIGAYQLLIQLFGLQYLLEEFGSQTFTIILLVIGNFGFIIYDLALNSVLALYHIRLRKRFFIK